MKLYFCIENIFVWYKYGGVLFCGNWPGCLKMLVSLRNHSTLITSVVPGDYDGDSQMDVLLTYLPQNHAGGELGAVIFWGQNQTLGEFVLEVFNIYHWILKQKYAIFLCKYNKIFFFLKSVQKRST